MRYPASEKLEIIRLVEQSPLPVKRTLEKLGIPRATFYHWCDLYRTGGPEALNDRSPRPKRIWNRIPDEVRERIKTLALEAVGPTENTKGEAMLDKMQAKCAAVSVESGDKKWIDGACALTDSDGDVVFSTFDTRDLDKSQPKMDCGTHIITGGTGKYKGITGTEPFACVTVDTPAGEPEGSFAIDIPHNTTWEIKE
jgi:hypothetical protein